MKNKCVYPSLENGPKIVCATIQVLYHGDSPRELSAATATHLESVLRIPCLVSQDSFTLASRWSTSDWTALYRSCLCGGTCIVDNVHWGAVGVRVRYCTLGGCGG